MRKIGSSQYAIGIQKTVLKACLQPVRQYKLKNISFTDIVHLTCYTFSQNSSFFVKMDEILPEDIQLPLSSAFHNALARQFYSTSSLPCYIFRLQTLHLNIDDQHFLARMIKIYQLVKHHPIRSLQTFPKRIR